MNDDTVYEVLFTSASDFARYNILLLFNLHMLIFLYFHMIRMASIPVKTSIGCMEFGKQCNEDQV